MSPEVTENLIRTGAILLGGLVGYWLIVRAGRQLVSRVSQKGPEHEERAATLWMVVRRLLLVVIVVAVVLAILGIWGFSLAPLLAAGTVVGAALGFGAQDLVRDMIAGFFILAEDQFRVGDVVTIAGTTGTVEDIQLRVTVLRDLEGNEHFVPNGQITVASNYTSKYAQPVIDVGISYDTDVDLALEILQGVLVELSQDPEWGEYISDQGEIFGVNELGDSSIVLRARLTTTAQDRWSVRREAFRRIKKAFDAEGITIPFPQVTVHRAD